MKYIRKIFKQDLRDGKQIAFPTEPSNLFFEFDFSNSPVDRPIIFTFKENDSTSDYIDLNNTEIPTRLYAAKSEARIDTELKNFLITSLDAEVDDIIIFSKKRNDSFEFIFAPKSTINYSSYKSLLNGNHELILSESQIIENNKELSKSETHQTDFNISAFHQDCADIANLKYSDQLVTRYISSLATKPFVLLSGLSGSGKTKLAEAFSSWITNDLGMQQVFTKDQRLLAKKATYIVRDISNTNITVESKGKSKAIVPFELVKFWADIIINNNYDIDTPSQTIQDMVREKYEDEMTYSTSHNSFHSILKSLALEMVTSRNKANFKSNLKKQVCMVSVGADWTNREPLLGYPNALIKGDYVRPESGVLDLILNAQEDSKNPYFLILDEMNMSHVERYFADFLSAMESVNSTISLHSGGGMEWNGVPSKVTLPKNLFIIGTVNVDETTYMFSPKVLDRANVIEFTVSKKEMEGYLDSSIKLDMKGLNGKGAHMAQNFVSTATTATTALSKTEKAEGLSDKLIPFFDDLQAVGAEFGYRTASEISRFVSVYGIINEGVAIDVAIDAAIVQKLLPKLHGSRNKLQRILVALAKQCLHDATSEDAFKDVNEDKIKYPISYEKLKRMHKRIMADGFTSFAEA